MNKLISVLLLGTALSLTACGGDSDSSGSTTSKTTSTDTTPTPTTPTNTQCNVEGANVYVPNEGSCNFSISSFNDGDSQTYTCNGSSVNVGGITGRTITLGGYTIQCAS